MTNYSIGGAEDLYTEGRKKRNLDVTRFVWLGFGSYEILLFGRIVVAGTSLSMHMSLVAG